MALQEMLQNLGGFQSLAANAQRMQQVEQQQTANKEASDLLRTFYKSQQEGKPDYNSLNEAILRSPDLAQNVLSGIGLQDKQRQQKAASDVVTLYQSLGNKDAFNRAAAVRVNDIMASGGDPKDTLELVRVYNERGPEAAAMSLKQVGAALVNQGLIRPELVGFGQPVDDENAKFQRLEDQRAKIEAEKGPEAAARFATFAGLTKRPVSEVSVNLPQDKKIAELDAKAFTQYSENAKSARKELNSIAALKPLSERAMSGAGASWMLTGGKLLNQLGFEIEGLTESEVFQQLANTLVLDKSQQMSGALSNADMAFLTNTVPTLENTKEGRRLSLDMAERLAKRQLEIQNLAVKFRREAKQNGDDFDDAEFQQYLNGWAEENPLFKDLEISKPKAPQAAIDYLISNPQFKQQFMDKYGYLPEGVK